MGPLDEKIKLSIVQVHKIISRLQATASMIKLLHEATAQGDDLCSPKHIVQAGWPSQIQEVPLEIQSHWNFGEEITIED